MGGATGLSAETDRFGNPIDHTVGYARGRILAGSHDEMLRDAHAQALIRDRANRRGPESVYVFTGSRCEFPVLPEDLAVRVEECVGPALFEADLRRLAIEHLGGRGDDEVAVFNRTSAGIIAAESALASEGETIVSFVPGATSHPSVKRGAVVARARLREVSSLDDLETALSAGAVPLVIVTGVTSELQVMPEDVFRRAIQLGKAAGSVVLVDDAYGARVRTVLHRQTPALQLEADMAITSNHKAGLDGPRAGLLAGRQTPVRAVLTRALELGQEARAPLALGVLRSLERYRPEHLLSEVAVGKLLHAALVARFGEGRVAETAIGPIMEADDVMAIAADVAGVDASTLPVVPAEATAGLGILLLEHHGILTVNALGAPGARVSLRLKATEDEVGRAGGADAVGQSIRDSIERLATAIQSEKDMRSLILGEGAATEATPGR